MPALGNRRNNSVLLGFVESVIGGNGQVSKVVNQHVKILIGDGQDIYFWSSNWTGQGQLWLIFLRIFALARSKLEPMKSFGRWVEEKWRCEIALHRQTLGDGYLGRLHENDRRFFFPSRRD